MEDTYRARASRHEEAVVRAEMRRLEKALRPYGILHRDSLRQACGAQKWHEGGFDRALREAVRRGLLEPLPGGFYRDGQRHRPDAPPSQTWQGGA